MAKRDLPFANRDCIRVELTPMSDVAHYSLYDEFHVTCIDYENAIVYLSRKREDQGGTDGEA